MKYLLRSFRSVAAIALLGAAACVAIAPVSVEAQGRGIATVLEGASPMLLSSPSQGYLGVDLADVDQAQAQALKLKEVRGAIITLVDHDAPAGQVGLKANDVVLHLNGQTVEGAEQLRRMLREIPAGRKVTLEISRDGSLQTLTVQLADRRAMEQDVWNRIGSGGNVLAPASGMGMFAGGGDAPLPGGFHMPLFGGNLHVGALVEPLTSQMAEALGVPSGLMVKQVAHKSEAAAAGLKAFDVILKVGSESIATIADWDRALRANRGKPVQVTVLRDKKQQTLTLQVDSKRHGELQELFPSGDLPLVAAIDPEQMEQLKQQMAQFRKSFKAEDFKIDPKQMDEFRQQMEQLKRQMEALKALDFGNHI